ncbi:MAG: 16S rRNA (guanine(527)-N(7))-methyltransferase RsmG [Sulfuriflexus sp.]|nr:16S rRNA (guanine(527)-N(7))-methyltransferase RsmG [Sulfuriflexus sp.]
MSSEIQPEKLASQLAEGLQSLDCKLADDIQAKLIQYLILLNKWNKTYNLTAVRDIYKMVPQHLLDSLSVNTYLQGKRVLDVGTGAGLPGIPLALANPDIEFVLLDSALKRTRFVVQAVGELGLKNVTVQQTRIEDYAPDDLFDTIISRAFTAMEDFVSATERLCAPAGQLLAMKGRFPSQEINSLPDQWLATSELLEVPSVNAERHIVILTRK